MAVRVQRVHIFADADKMARFWAAALHYQLEPPPEGFANWDAYYRDLGVGEEDLGIGEDSINDPEGNGPPIWFHRVPDPKIITNPLHIAILAPPCPHLPPSTPPHPPAT